MELRWSVGPDVGEAVLRAVHGRGLGLGPQETRDCQITVWNANGRLGTHGYAGQVLRNELAARLGHGFLTAYQTAVGAVERGATCLRRVRSSVECVYARGGAWVYLRYAAAGRYGNAGCLVTGALAPGATVRAARDVTVAARFGALPCEGCVEADDFDVAIRPHVTERCP